MERITGPHHGYYIATHASDTAAPGGWLGYAKLCRRRPDGYWDANCLAKLCGTQVHDTPGAALDEVQVLAAAQLAVLAAPAGAVVA